MTNHTKTKHVLPKEATDALAQVSSADEQASYMAALRQAGWTLQSIADPVGLSRERVRQIIRDTPANEVYGGEVPTPPLKSVKPKRTFVEPDPEVLAEMLELKPLVAQVRGNSPAYREEAERFNQLLWDSVRPVSEGGKGVTIYRMAKRLGLQHGAIRSRLGRYRLRENKAYKPVLEENRAL